MLKKLAALILLFMTVNIYAAKIVCTTYPVWLLTRMISEGTDASTELLTPPAGGCAHGYTPLPGDLIKVKDNSVILIANGRGVDDHLVHAALRANNALHVIKAEVAASDPHTFASVDTARLMIIKITDGLSSADPANKAIYQQNLQKVLPRFDRLIQQAKNLPCKHKTVVLHHKLFCNLAELCQVNILLLKVEQSSTLRAADLMQLIRRARRAHAGVIWTENHHHDPAVKLFLRESRAHAVELNMLTGGSINVPVDHYLVVMKNNLDKLEYSTR